MTQPTLWGDAAEFNATGSPTGRISRDASSTSVHAATTVNAPSHRAIILDALVRFGPLTSIELAHLMPLTRQGTPQVSNRSSSRLGELWRKEKPP